MKHYIEFETAEQASLAKQMLDHQLPTETDHQKEMILSIAKKVYTKCRTSNKIPYEVIEEMGQKIRERDYFYMSMTFSKVGLQFLTKML